MARKMVFALLVLIVIALSVACTQMQSCPAPQVNVPNPASAPTSTSAAGLANPASVYCEQNSGKLQIVTAADGSQSGVCTFPAGSKCDEWAYFRGECQPGDSLVNHTPTSGSTPNRTK